MPSLTSKVIKITAIGRDGLGPTTIVADEAEGLRYKVYLEDEENCAETVADGERTFPALPFGRIMYVVVATLGTGTGLATRSGSKAAPP